MPAVLETASVLGVDTVCLIDKELAGVGGFLLSSAVGLDGERSGVFVEW